MDSECEHTNYIQTTSGDTCTDCGRVLIDDIFEYETQPIMDEQYQCFRTDKQEPFSYQVEISKLDLDPRICVNVHKQIEKLEHKTHVRRSTYIKNLFTMIYSAYIEENIPFNVSNLRNSLGMNAKQTREAIKQLPPSVTLDTHNPFSFFREITDKFKDQYDFPKELLSKVEKFINLLVENNSMICNESPDGIAVAVYKIFLDRNGIHIKNFNKKSGRTQLYIKVRENMIYDICNKLASKSSMTV